MANVLTGISMESSKHGTRRVLKVALSGAYVQAVPGANPAGELLDLTSIQNTKGIDGIKSFNNLPDYQGAFPLPLGYVGVIIPGATLKTYILKIYTAEGAELGAGAYPAGLLDATPPECPIFIEIGHAKSNR
jgi:hypothetical protein